MHGDKRALQVHQMLAQAKKRTGGPLPSSIVRLFSSPFPQWRTHDGPSHIVGITSLVTDAKSFKPVFP